MSDIDTALDRMNAAVAALETELDAALSRDDAAMVEPTAAAPELKNERDELADEVQALRERAKEDAKLRAEAAIAVREALYDLRGAVNQSGVQNEAEHV